MTDTKETASSFETLAREHDGLFDTHLYVYQSEAQAVRRYVPARGPGVGIGVGTGRFSAPFSITIGVEPSETVAAIAGSRGIIYTDPHWMYTELWIRDQLLQNIRNIINSHFSIHEIPFSFDMNQLYQNKYMNAEGLCRYQLDCFEFLALSR